MRSNRVACSMAMASAQLPACSIATAGATNCSMDFMPERTSSWSSTSSTFFGMGVRLKEGEAELRAGVARRAWVADAL